MGEFSKILKKVAEPKKNFAEECIRIVGKELNVPLVIDDEIHRWGNDKECWYVLHFTERGVVYGSLGDWSQSLSERFSSSELTTEELQIARVREIDDRRKRKEIEKENQKDAARKYMYLSSAKDDHPYLERKGVPSMPDFKVDGNDNLIIPLFDNDGSFVTWQSIDKDGKKRFYPGISSSGVRYVIQGGARIFLCEGVATGLSIHEATGATVVCCMNAGNIKKVAPDYKGAIVVADNDESKTGENACEGLPYTLIPEVGMDANDYASTYGVDALRSFLLGGEKKETYSIPLIDWALSPSSSSYMLKGYFSRGQFGTIIGAPASGKTFLTLDIMLALSSGLALWHGIKTNGKRNRVYYLCGEGFEGIKKRVKAWMKKNGVTDIGQINISRDSKDLTNNNDLAEVLEDIARVAEMWGGIDLIVIDTYNQFNSGDENAADSVHAFLEKFEKVVIKLYGCAVAMLHHTGVSSDAQKRGRGSSALRGAVDFEFLVEKAETGEVVLSQTKQKDIDLGKKMAFVLEPVGLDEFDEDGEEIFSAVPVLSEGDSVRKLAPYFHFYGLFFGPWMENHVYSLEEGFYRVPSSEMEEFTAFYKRIMDGKEVSLSGARRMLKSDREIGKMLGQRLVKKEDGFYHLRGL